MLQLLQVISLRGKRLKKKDYFLVESFYCYRHRQQQKLCGQVGPSLGFDSGQWSHYFVYVNVMVLTFN